ncbi:M24 family metallopeptidase [Coralliovum pocilloporae]|uniref:M24 family metallopeptidase n=1 Tax=Coralliovum pocilloporae TaxID=3066369 RepID=UPI003307426C
MSAFDNPFSVSNRKIDPTRRQHLKPDGTPDNNDRVEIGPTSLAFQEWTDLGLTAPDMPSLREYRLSRIRAELKKRDYAGILMWDPLNIRYATDSTNMQLWITHNSARACFIATEGPVVLFDFHSCNHLSEHLPLVDEIRTVTSFFYFESAQRTPEMAKSFAAEIDELVRKYGGGNRRLAVDKMEIAGVWAFQEIGLELMNGQEVTEFARLVKNDNEVNAMRCAIAACEISMQEMRDAFYHGITEDELWSHLHAGNIKRGGEWIETRILSSGPRTNPWFQECGPRHISEGDLLSFDTDLIGPYGYCSDLSRSWICGDGKPTDEQKRLYQYAHEHIMTNTERLKPGMSFEELTFGGHNLAEEFVPLRYGVKYHGVGLCDEYPSIRYPQDYEHCGYEGVTVPGMVLCVEAYIGVVGGTDGIKLEDQVLITDTGYDRLSNFPFEDDFLK